MASVAARARVLAGYRRLNRARFTVFQGDAHAMEVSRQQMRAEFKKNMGVPASGPQWEMMVAGIDEAADMLKHEIIRGELDDQSGRYKMKIKKEHVRGSATGETKPELEPITEETYERMANPAKVTVCKSSGNKEEPSR